MKLEVKEYLVSAALYFTNDLGSGRVEQLHAYLDKRLFLGKEVEESVRLSSARKIAGNNYVLIHCGILL